jgi:hypothetical protein
MTLPAERTKSVVDTRQLLEMLANAEDVTVPGLVQSVATCLLKHFPSSVDLQISASAAPEIWAPPSTHGQNKKRTASVRIVAVNGNWTDKR